MQSDRLEGEFSIYRQGHGGCYYISVDQILSSARLRRMQIYGELQCDQVDHGESECCRAEVSHADVRKLDDIHIRVDHLSSEERASIYYICGYIAHKENFPRMPEPGRDSLPEDSEFTALLSRGRLRYPPEWLVVYACFCYTYFLTSKSQCVNYIVRVFLLIFESFLDVPVGPIMLVQVSRRLSNCFFKGFVRRESEVPRLQTGANERRLRKLLSTR